MDGTLGHESQPALTLGEARHELVDLELDLDDAERRAVDIPTRRS
jgi:hypothetical protein